MNVIYVFIYYILTKNYEHYKLQPAVGNALIKCDITGTVLIMFTQLI